MCRLNGCAAFAANIAKCRMDSLRAGLSFWQSIRSTVNWRSEPVRNSRGRRARGDAPSSGRSNRVPPATKPAVARA